VLPDKSGNSRVFANQQQRKFYMITRAFKIGNIVAAVAVMLYFGRHFFGD
jgi:hypothetical protein